MTGNNDMARRDYGFGDYVLEMRKRTGMSQSELASRLGMTNKAVSKWETGAAKPKTNTIRRLAALWHVSVDELLRLRDDRKAPRVTKVVITGGPCAGKSTAMSWIQNAFSQRGYEVLFIPETATELISGGVTPRSCGAATDFQRCTLDLQLAKERVFEAAASTMDAEKVLVVCDRGALDAKAYMDELDYGAMLMARDTNEVELRDGYDAVFHLVTAAKGAVEFYTCDNNSARTETPEEAALLDDKIISAWTGHPHLRIIDNAGDFEEKMRRLIAEIASFLGEPEPLEIERKYLIEYPDIAWLERSPNCQRVEIIQTYLASASGDEVRVRQRGERGHYVYYKTTKRTVSGLKRVEVERRLSKDEYLTLLMETDTSRRQIRKTRYCLTHEGQYFEIDVFPFWDDRAILEIELSSEDDEVTLPKKVKVIREVTDDEGYKNASLAIIGREDPPR